MRRKSDREWVQRGGVGVSEEDECEAMFRVIHSRGHHCGHCRG